MIRAPQAVEDLGAVCMFIARDSEVDAGDFTARVVGAVELLQEFPEAGRVTLDLPTLLSANSCTDIAASLAGSRQKPFTSSRCSTGPALSGSAPGSASHFGQGTRATS